MAEETSNPLLQLVHSQGMIDDLQFEDVLGELKRSGKPVFQIIQDFQLMDADSLLQTMANHLGTEVVDIRNVNIPKEAIAAIPSNSAKTYRCVPVDMHDSTLRVAFEDPLNPSHIDELTFVAKKDIQVVVANPSDIQNAIDKYYGADMGGEVDEILKQLGGDDKIAEEVVAAVEMDDEQMVASLANEAPIVRFVNLVLFQAVKDRASDIHFEPFVG